MDKETEELQTGEDALASLASLLKAHNGNGGDDATKLSKAKPKEEPGEDKDDEYSKFSKMMKGKGDMLTRYMRENGYMSGMKKASAGVAETASRGMLEMEETGAESIMFPGTELLKAFGNFALVMQETLEKAFNGFDSRLDAIEKAQDVHLDIAKASGEVMLKAAKDVDAIAGKTQPLKTVLHGQDITKAGEQHRQQKRDELAVALQKARYFGPSGIKQRLVKASVDGNQAASQAVSYVEMGGIDQWPKFVFATINDIIPDSEVLN